MKLRSIFALFGGLGALAASSLALADAQVVILAGPNSGLDDPTPAQPVGGNPGVTIGQQRAFAYLRAAELWGARLESDVPIYVDAEFSPLPCGAGGAVLGSAGPSTVFANFLPPGELVDETWYVTAEADSLSGIDLIEAAFGLSVFPDIFSTFNSNIDAGCLGGRQWYYGLDGNNGGDLDFLAVVMHEINHGLGHLDLVGTDGSLFAGRNDIYMTNMFDLDIGRRWSEMSTEERFSSNTNTDRLVWVGDAVNTDAAMFLGDKPAIKLKSGDEGPNGLYEAQPASFGPSFDSLDDDKRIVLVNDGTEPATDACEPFPRKQARQLRSRIALIDRGGCSFVQKVANVEAAGAKGAIIANNQPKGRTPMGGSDDSIGIPSVGITMALGDEIKSALEEGKVKAAFRFNESELAGTSEGLVRLYAPDPFEPGSSNSHWDPSATPNLLMEPSINSDLDPTATLDLSLGLLTDIGWNVIAPPPTVTQTGGGENNDDDKADDDD